MIREVALLQVRPGHAVAFERDFSVAAEFIQRIDGYVSHELGRGIKSPQRYVLLVQWRTLEAHTIGFRESPEYQEWKRLLHPYYSPFPTVEHFTPVHVAP